jgi:hypothetical protein
MVSMATLRGTRIKFTLFLHPPRKWRSSPIVEGGEKVAAPLKWWISYYLYVLQVCFRRLGSTKEFNVDDFSSRMLVLRGMWTKTASIGVPR